MRTPSKGRAIPLVGFHFSRAGLGFLWQLVIMQQLHLWTWGYGSSSHTTVALEELNFYSISWDWVSRWVREHVRRSKMSAALPPQPLAFLPAHRRGLSRALAPLPLTTVLSGELGLLSSHLSTTVGMWGALPPESCLTAIHGPFHFASLYSIIPRAISWNKCLEDKESI